MQDHLTKSLGHTPSQTELQELEFTKIYQLMASDGQISAKEQKRLDQWTKRHRWTPEKVSTLTQEAQKESALSTSSPRENLSSLIRFSLADGHIDRREMKCLEHAANHRGISRLELSSLISQIQRV